MVSRHHTPRLRYVLRHVLCQHLGLDFSFVSTKEEVPPNSAAIFYDNEPETGSFSIPEAGLLSEVGVRSQQPEVQGRGHEVRLFPSPGYHTFSFDLFSAIFYLLSRYEEHLPFDADVHGRFPAAASLGHQHDFLEVPVVQLWVRELREKLHSHFPFLEMSWPPFHFQPSLDIDQALSVRGKGLLRTTGSLVRSLKSPQELAQRLQVLAHLRPDPFDNFEYLKDLHQKHEIRPLVFFLMAPWSPWNKNLNPRGRHMQRLIRQVRQWADVGLHPGYEAATDASALLAQKKLLEQTIQQPVAKSRQHYLRLLFPETAHTLLQLGMEADYSLAFADAPGFRAGTAVPFPFYDLQREEETSLRLYPSCVMDVTLRHYLRLSPEMAIERVLAILNEVLRAGGWFIPIWHNESLSEQGPWEDWRKVYERLLQRGKELSS